MIQTKDLYLHTTEQRQIEPARFLTCLSTYLRALLARYPTGLLADAGDGMITLPEGLDENCGLHPLYEGALLCGILAEDGGDEKEKEAALAEAELAFRTRWRQIARGKRLAVQDRW